MLSEGSREGLDQGFPKFIYNPCFLIVPIIPFFPSSSSFSFFNLLATPQGMGENLSSPTRYRTCAALHWKHRVLTTGPPGRSPPNHSSKNKFQDTNKSAKHKTTHRLKRMNLWVLGSRMGEGIVRESGMDMYTLLYLKWGTDGPTVKHRELCSMLWGSLDGRGV